MDLPHRAARQLRGVSDLQSQKQIPQAFGAGSEPLRRIQQAEDHNYPGLDPIEITGMQIERVVVE